MIRGCCGWVVQTNANLFHAFGNNPVCYKDPDGREDRDFAKNIAHAVLGNPISVQAAKNGTFPTEAFGFTFDASENVFHTTTDAIQSIGGYNPLYDKIFDTFTSMDALRFDFTSNGNDYTIWAWKGDYLNLGAGCEVGVYTKPLILSSLGIDHFVVDKNLAMSSTQKLYKNGNLIGSYSGMHWWPAIFNPNEQNVQANELNSVTIFDFGGKKQMYADFKNKWKMDSHWIFDDEKFTATLTF